MMRPFNISKQIWLPGSFGIPQSLSDTEHGQHNQTPTLNFAAQGLDYPSPRGSSLYNPDILVACPCLLAAKPGFPFSSPHGPTQSGHVQSVLSQMSLSLPLLILSLLSTIHFLLHHTQKQSCPFLFIFLFSFSIRISVITQKNSRNMLILSFNRTPAAHFCHYLRVIDFSENLAVVWS